MMLRRTLLPTCRCFGHAAQSNLSPYLHDLVGDSSQPGILGGYGVKSVALVDMILGEVVFREKALRSISRGEELSFDYTTTEWTLDKGGFVDHSTLRPVKGFKYLEEEEKRRLLEAGLLPVHVMQLWLGELLDT